jgi:hypothetical protein
MNTSFLIGLIVSAAALGVVVYNWQRWKIPIGWASILVSIGVGMIWAGNLGVVRNGLWELLLFSYLPIGAGLFILYRAVSKAKKKAATPKRKQVKRPVKEEGFNERLVEKVEMLSEKGSGTLEWSAPNIFITYRRSDSPNITGRIYDRLVQEFGKATVFKDVDSIPLGVDFREHIDKKVGECNVVLVVIGNEWLTVKNEQGQRRLDDPLDFVHLEIEAALRREIPVIPLLVQGAGMPAADQLPDALQLLAFRNGIPIRPDPDFHNDMNRLVRGIAQYGWK